MNVLLGVAVLLVVAIAVVAWLLGRRNRPTLWDDDVWIVDPLDLQPLGADTAHVFMSVPRMDGVREVIPLIVNAANRSRYLRHGPLAFVRGLRRIGLLGEAKCLVGQNRDLSQAMSLETLCEKLFDGMDSTKAVGLIHDMTEVDLPSVEDEETIALHLLRSGFEPLNAVKAKPPVSVCDIKPQHRFRVWCDEEM